MLDKRRRGTGIVEKADSAAISAAISSAGDTAVGTNSSTDSATAEDKKSTIQSSQKRKND